MTNAHRSNPTIHWSFEFEREGPGPANGSRNVSDIQHGSTGS